MWPLFYDLISLHKHQCLLSEISALGSAPNTDCSTRALPRGDPGKPELNCAWRALALQQEWGAVRTTVDACAFDSELVHQAGWRGSQTAHAIHGSDGMPGLEDTCRTWKCIRIAHIRPSLQPCILSIHLPRVLTRSANL